MAPSDTPKRRITFVPCSSPNAQSFEFAPPREANDLCYRATARLESMLPMRSRHNTDPQFPEARSRASTATFQARQPGPAATSPTPSVPPPKRDGRCFELRLRATIEPTKLAELLDAWALRREKVVHLLDLRAARTARALAAKCRSLGESLDSPPDEIGWNSVKAEVAELFDSYPMEEIPRELFAGMTFDGSRSDSSHPRW